MEEELLRGAEPEVGQSQMGMIAYQGVVLGLAGKMFQGRGRRKV